MQKEQAEATTHSFHPSPSQNSRQPKLFVLVRCKSEILDSRAARAVLCLLSPQRASAQHLEWLKTVKESHGSVELSSLSLAAAINSRGVYVLRAPADGQKVRPLSSSCCPSAALASGRASAPAMLTISALQVSLDSVLRFTLPGSSGDAEATWKYSLAELRELQNKLMLMSAKGEQGLEVERFSEVRFQTQGLLLLGARAGFALGYELLGLWVTVELLGVVVTGTWMFLPLVPC